MSLGHLISLLDEHDGDDRCQCLRLALTLAYAEDNDLQSTINIVSACLAIHPAGITMRERFNRSLNRSLD